MVKKPILIVLLLIVGAISIAVMRRASPPEAVYEPAEELQVIAEPVVPPVTIVPLSTSRSAEMRPLGSRLEVDGNGTIYRGEHPVGVWGVNGDTPAMRVR